MLHPAQRPSGEQKTEKQAALMTKDWNCTAAEFFFFFVKL